MKAKRPIPKGRISQLQALGVATGLIERKSVEEISKENGVPERAVVEAKSDPYINGLVSRLMGEYEPEVRKCFGRMMYTLERDLAAEDPAIVSSARKDLVRVMALASQSEKDIPTPINVDKAVICLPISVPTLPSLPPIKITTDR